MPGSLGFYGAGCLVSGAMVPAAWPWYTLVSSSLGSPLSCGPGSTRRRCAGSCRRLETGRTQRSRSDLFMGCCQVTWTSGLMPGHWVKGRDVGVSTHHGLCKHDDGSSRTGTHFSFFRQPQKYERREGG